MNIWVQEVLEANIILILIMDMSCMAQCKKRIRDGLKIELAT